MIALITTALGIIAVLLEIWVQNKPRRSAKDVQDEDQKLRTECNDLDADAISARIDGLLNPSAGHPAGVGDGSAQAGPASPP